MAVARQRICDTCRHLLSRAQQHCRIAGPKASSRRGQKKGPPSLGSGRAFIDRGIASGRLELSWGLGSSNAIFLQIGLGRLWQSGDHMSDLGD